MWSAKGTANTYGCGGRREGVELGDSDGFLIGERREKIGGGTGEKSLAGARWAGNENIMMPSNSHCESTFSKILATDMV